MFIARNGRNPNQKLGTVYVGIDTSECLMVVEW
jgi:hypothetical protein